MLSVRPLVIKATAQPYQPKPKKSVQIAKKLKQAINHASLICINHEDTKECGVAWDQVEELSAALNDALTEAINDEHVWFDEKSKREYDV
jgi:hypothetical protein